MTDVGVDDLAPEVPATKGERTRRRLLHLAIERFAEEGYRATSLAAVARDAGVTPAAAYAYYPGKEAMFRAAVDADAGALIERLVREEGDGPILEQLPGRLERLVGALADHPLARRVLAGLEPAVIGRLVTLPSLVELRRVTADELAAAQRRGEVRAGLDPAGATLAIETLVLALTMSLLQTHGLAPDEVEARRVAVVQLLGAALRP